MKNGSNNFEMFTCFPFFGFDVISDHKLLYV